MNERRRSFRLRHDDVGARELEQEQLALVAGTSVSYLKLAFRGAVGRPVHEAALTVA